MEENEKAKHQSEAKTAETEIRDKSIPAPILMEVTENKATAQEEQTPPVAENVSVQVQILKELKGLIENRLSYDSAKEKAIDKLSDEVKFYRENFVFQSQKPIFIELIMLYDSLERIINSFSVEQDISKEQVLTLSNNLGNLKEELLEVLYKRDIVQFEEHHEFLDYKLHKTVKTVPTVVESENNKIEKVTKCGFRYNDKVLRPEEVVIKKFVKA